MAGLTLLLVAFLMLCHPSAGCSVPESQRDTVIFLLRSMLRSLGEDVLNPNPSVMIALRLAREHNLNKEAELLRELKEAAIRKVQNDEDFSSGLVALYTLALTASCSDPCNVTSNGFTVNLLHLLEEKLSKEIKNFEDKLFPLTNYYQVSLDVLALCVKKRQIPHRSVLTLTDAVMNDTLSHGTGFSVDTGAVAALALRCLIEADYSLIAARIESALQKVIGQIIDNVKGDGIIGNLYSTGLAIQALSTNINLVSLESWNCSKSLQKLLTEIKKGSFGNAQAASQISPSLDGRTYLDVGKLNCAADVDNLTLPELSTSSPPVTERVPIRVQYNITDGLHHTFSYAVNVTVPRGSPLLEVLQEARRADPERFSFKLKMTFWGPSVTSIGGLESDSYNRTYWQFLNGTKLLDQGIGSYQPSNGERILANFTTY
ncbi:cobalamin binding intrinsic factor-like isoform X2 [Heptranchias perlo]|uniref:cobalamin binding intrinsic factor-like isoform X2 n=1 Tax=Heptranchias perlo TaxID=212740 RepID=UPI003559A1AF